MHTRAGVGPAAAKAVKNNPNLRGAMGKDSSRVRVQWHSIVLMEAAEYFAQCLPLEPLDTWRGSNFMTPPHWMARYYSNICLPCRTRTTSVQWLGNPSWLGDWVPLIPHVTGALSHFLKPPSACWDLLRLGKRVSWPKGWACLRNYITSFCRFWATNPTTSLWFVFFSSCLFFCACLILLVLVCDTHREVGPPFQV